MERVRSFAPLAGRERFVSIFWIWAMIPGAEVTVVKLAPMGDPMELQIHGYELTLRLAEADQIEIEQIARRSRAHEGMEMLHDCEHPGLGEEGKYHSKKDENPLPDGTYADICSGGKSELWKDNVI